jgi:ribosomal protein RSM22 (predicted rRNA methylase)
VPVLGSAKAIVWVEPGTPALARRLVEVRETLRTRFRPIAPCPHDGVCGMLRPERVSDWCHLFATPAAEAFTSGHWRRFSDELGIDLRSLPTSYLVLVRDDAAPPPRPEGDLARPLGRAKLEKGRALLDLCRPEGIVRARLLERDDRAVAKRLASRKPFHPLLDVQLEGERLRALRSVDATDQ